jgi:hypothetical protein
MMPNNNYSLGLKFLLVSFVFMVSGCAISNHQKNVKSPQIDRISEAELARLAPAPVAVLTLDDIVQLSKEGSSTDLIIEKIKASNSIYDLTPSQSVALSQQGVSNKVLDYIHTSRERAWRNSIAEEINQRDKVQRDEIKKLKSQQDQQRRLYDPFCRGLYPYGYGYYGQRFGHHLGVGAGSIWPRGCW